MKILIPGGAGYIGAWMVPQLLADGHTVTVYDTQWFGSGYLPHNDHVRVIKDDIRSLKGITDACVGQDAVICLAAISAESMCQKYTTLARTVNVGGVMNVAASAKLAGVKRFIFASSVAAYGSADQDATEATPLAPTTIYGECKAEGERLVREAFPEAIILRAASVCGYSPHQRFDLTVNKMAHDAMRYRQITVCGGAQKRSHIHMRDIVEVYKRLLVAPNVEGQTFNAVADNLTVRGTARIVANVIGRVEIEIKERSDDRSYTVDGEKLRNALNWTHSYGVMDAAHDLKVRFESGMWKDSDINPVYQNMASGLV